ncbi:MAG: hypothetical protein PHN75_18730 [Syntrophales bacterium]|nr:hypothetical protein [Syntrophales bacterium]
MIKTLFPLGTILFLCICISGCAGSLVIKNDCPVPVSVIAYVPDCEVVHPGGRCSSPKPECGNFNPLAPDEPTYNPAWRCFSPKADCRREAPARGETTAAGCTDCISRIEASYRKANGSSGRMEKDVTDVWSCLFKGKYTVRIIQTSPDGPECDIE